MSATDLELLRDFARDQSQEAFTALVRRHVDLVYSAALRQVRSPQLAEEVAQSVFTDLAHDALRLKPETVLAAWLYQVTRRTAIDVVRREARRQQREQIAVEMNATESTAADWTRIAPLLDEAMHALESADRTAVLLRYFENKSLREVGDALGTSDEAARKRISRAVERLREFFSKRGVTIGASGLVFVVSAQAVQSAPAGLAASVSAGTSSVCAAAVVTSTTAVTMKLLNVKIALASVAVLFLAGGAYVGWESRARADRSQPDTQAHATNELLYAEMLAAYPIASEVLEGHPSRVIWEDCRAALLRAGYIETRQIPFARAGTNRLSARTFFDQFRQRFGAVELTISGLGGDTPAFAVVTARKSDLGPNGVIDQFIRSYQPPRK